MQPLLPDGRPNLHADRGALARLRRASTPLDALDEAAVFALHRALGYGQARAEETLPLVAVAAAVLAHVRDHDPTAKPARAVGRASLADHTFETAALSPLRLKRLLQAREPEDLLRQMRRLVALARGRLDVGALAVLILDWGEEVRGPLLRSRFAYDYHAGAGDPPGFTTPPTA
ncbi:type I-E CRISPR-associated protein Cse2/CasB (plasmid) [Methylobacterium currus]|nr:type I-E CRISPR-associated protein Cse2/CasB [Methylobacterium currus]UHC20437.1 type I-E CRISPR-associated protein Cse2/CasB [Methylobacterium currus]